MSRYSYSKVASFLRCPRAFRLRYLDDAPTERTSLALPFGSSFHDAVEHDMRERAAGTTPTVEALHAKFREMFAARVEIAGPDVDGDPAAAVPLAEKMLAAYRAADPLRGLAPAVEKRVVAEIAPGLELEGFVDFFVDGETPEVVELKTSARAWCQSQADWSLQGDAYALLTGASVVRFVVVTKTKQPAVQELRTYPSPERRRRLVETVRDVDAAVRAGAFPRHATPQNCVRCEYRDRCLGGVPVAALEAVDV
jgi:CRISPR/Cas system-associated exonuclease Cas4 (RecB family)